MKTATAYLALEKPNSNWPGTITFDAQYAQSLRATCNVYKVGTVTCDKITYTAGIAAVTINGKTYDNGYDYLRDSNPIQFDAKLTEHYTAIVKRYAAER